MDEMEKAAARFLVSLHYYMQELLIITLSISIYICIDIFRCVLITRRILRHTKVFYPISMGGVLRINLTSMEGGSLHRPISTLGYSPYCQLGL